MATQTLTWDLNSSGGFDEAARWTPGEAPTPGIGQNLNVLGGGITLRAAPLDDYTFNLLPGGSTVYINLYDQAFDGETVVQQTAPEAFLYASGGVTNAGEMRFGATGVATATTLQLAPGAAFANNGTIEVSGALVVERYTNFRPGPGETAPTFQNNGTVAVDGGTAVINNLVPGQAGSNFIVEDGGTLRLNGFTNASVSFAAGSDGRVLFDRPKAADSVAAIKGFDQGDEIVIEGNAASANYVGDGAGGALVLADASGAEIGRIPFSGAYATGDFAVAAAPGAKTAIGSNRVAPAAALPPAEQAAAGNSVQTDAPVLDLDDYGRRAAAVTAEGGDDVSFALPRSLTVRGTAVSRADFLDGSLVFDSASPEGRYVPNEDASAIARMYYTVLGRPPEFAGEKYWVGVMDAYDYGIQTLAPFFYGSPEFQARYGAGTTDAQFVDLLYGNILGRGGEAEGTAFWQGQLAGGASRAAVVVAFSESSEHKAIRYDAIERDGIAFSGDPFV